jgi:chitodextrinase
MGIRMNGCAKSRTNVLDIFQLFQYNGSTLIFFYTLPIHISIYLEGNMKAHTSNRKSGLLWLVSLLLFLQFCMTGAASAATDTQPPTAPGQPAVININYTSISLCWAAASDNTGVKGYHLYRDGKKILTITKTSYTNTDLVPGRKYSYMVRAYDAAGNVSSDSAVVHVTTKSDMEAPSTPGTPSVLSRDFTTVGLTWNPSADNTSVKCYEIYCGDRKVASTSATYYVCKGLTPGQTYAFFVKALDIAGNYSMPGNSVSAATVSDNAAPSVPSGLKASSITGTEITLTWSPSMDNVKVKGYELFRNGSKLGTTSKTTYCSKGLDPGKSYTYVVRAIDSVGNISGESSPLATTTQKDLEAPTAPTGLKTKSIKGSSVSLTWNASTDNIKVKGYHIYCNGIRVASTTRTGSTVKSPAGLGLGVYYVKAYDLVDNVSVSSNKVTVIIIK